MNLKLFGTQVLVKPDVDTDKEQKTKTGIILITPANQEKHFAKGTVVTVGDAVSKVTAGDVVYYSQMQAGIFEYNEEKYDMIQEPSLIGVFVD